MCGWRLHPAIPSLKGRAVSAKAGLMWSFMAASWGAVRAGGGVAGLQALALLLGLAAALGRPGAAGSLPGGAGAHHGRSQRLFHRPASLETSVEGVGRDAVLPGELGAALAAAVDGGGERPLLAPPFAHPFVHHGGGEAGP